MTLMRLTGRLGHEDRAVVGGKAVGLAALARAGLIIPDTWVVPVDSTPGDELAGLADVAPRWAVRSSATVEDGGTRSYAGMFRTDLDVPVSGLSDAIRRVQASARSSRVAAYRSWTRDDGEFGVAVLLQPFQRPLYGGLWLGRGLATGRLEWVSGSGEALVSGAITPAWEEWTPAGHVGGSDVLESYGRPIGEACVEVQRRIGVPADLEFAILPAGLVWLQFRPMTTSLGTAPRRTEQADDQVVRGTAAAPGRVEGQARLLRDVTDPDWTPGSVLLTRQTDPDWTPLMAEAAALVTAAGGMLCHAAIVARELGVPCVTGVGTDALSRLAAGGTVAVDGDEGTVSIL
jgi:pyruvate,water dikinase